MKPLNSKKAFRLVWILLASLVVMSMLSFLVAPLF